MESFTKQSKWHLREYSQTSQDNRLDQEHKKELRIKMYEKVVYKRKYDYFKNNFRKEENLYSILFPWLSICFKISIDSFSICVRRKG